MRKVKEILLIVLILMGGVSLKAQNLKFGHINSRELLLSMPESDSAQKKIQKLAQDYEMQMEEMQVELNKKYDTYLQNRDNYTELIRQTKEADIQEMQQRISNFEQMAQQDLQTKQNEMMRPILDKANAAIKKVAEENGFIYIFDTGSGNPVYWSDQSVDITTLAKSKLGK